MKRLQQFACAAVLASLSLGAHATDSEAMAQKYLESIKNLDAAGLSHCVRSSDLDDFKKNLLPAFETEHKAGQRQLLDATFGPSTAYESLGLTPADTFFSHVMQLVMQPRPDQPRPDIQEPKILGEVTETPTLVHVVVRESAKIQGKTASKVDLVSVVRDNGGWKVIMPAEIGMAAMALRQQVEMMYHSKPAARSKHAK